MFDDEDIEAVVSLSGVKPVMVDERKTALVTVPVSKAVLTPTMLDAELGFLRKLIVKTICCTDLVVARLIVATWVVTEQLDMVTPVVD